MWDHFDTYEPLLLFAFLHIFRDKIMARLGRPAKKRGLLAKQKRITHRRSIGPLEKGIVIGQFLAAEKSKTVFNASEAARSVKAYPKVVGEAIKNFKSGKLMPLTQPAAAESSVSVKTTLIGKRRECVRKNAVKRCRAEDGTPRPVYATQKDLLDSLPPNLRPTSTTTISRDLRAEGVYWLSTVSTPCLGPAWRKKRVAYCKETPKLYPSATYAPLLIATDESMLNVNNAHSCKKEYRTRAMRPMQRKKIKFPPQVMIWTAVSKKMRKIVVHVPDEDDEEDDDDPPKVVYKTKKIMVEAEKIVLKHVSETKRYTMKELDMLPKRAQLEWLELERRFNAHKPTKGVNRFDHCHKCLGALKDELNGADHLILEDNAKIHTSCYTKLYRKHLGLKYVDNHPADAADLNPCEHVFAWVKKKVAFRGPPTKEALIKAITEEFRKIPQHCIDAWIDSWWTRMEACKKANGEWVGERECRRAKGVKRQRK